MAIDQLDIPLGEVPSVPRDISPEVYQQLMEYHVSFKLLVLKVNELVEAVNAIIE